MQKEVVLKGGRGGGRGGGRSGGRERSERKIIIEC